VVTSTALTTFACLCVRSPRWFWMFRAVMVRVGAGGDGKHCFRLIQTVQEELQGIPAGCSFNNSRVAEVQVCGSYARGHSFLPFLIFFDIFLFDGRRPLLILPFYSMGKNGVRSGAGVGRCAGAIRTVSPSSARQPLCIGSSSMPYGLLVHPQRRCHIFCYFLDFWLSVYRQAVQNTSLCVHCRRHVGTRACTCDV
jgi:hypothetical protein